MSSSVGIILPNIWKNRICSKPPTRMDPYMGIGGWLIISPQIPITDLGALEELASHARFDCMFLIRILWTRQSHLVRFLLVFLSLSDHKEATVRNKLASFSLSLHFSLIFLCFQFCKSSFCWLKTCVSSINPFCWG